MLFEKAEASAWNVLPWRILGPFVDGGDASSTRSGLPGADRSGEPRSAWHSRGRRSGGALGLRHFLGSQRRCVALHGRRPYSAQRGWQGAGDQRGPGERAARRSPREVQSMVAIFITSRLIATGTRDKRHGRA